MIFKKLILVLLCSGDKNEIPRLEQGISKPAPRHLNHLFPAMFPIKNN